MLESKNFLKRIDKKILGSLTFLMFTHWLQIPHFLWTADCFLDGEMICNQYGPIVDFGLYGVDLLEIPAIFVVTLAFIARYKNNVK